MVGEFWVHYKHKGKGHRFASSDTWKRTIAWAKSYNKYNKKDKVFLTLRKKPKKNRKTGSPLHKIYYQKEANPFGLPF